MFELREQLIALLFIAFCLMGAQFIDNCLKAGWQRKDSIDWAPYEQALHDLNPTA